MALRDLRSCLKHRIHRALERYGLRGQGFTDLFGNTERMVATQLEAMDELTARIEAIERRIQKQIVPSEEVRLLLSSPRVGPILVFRPRRSTQPSSPCTDGGVRRPATARQQLRAPSCFASIARPLGVSSPSPS